MALLPQLEAVFGRAIWMIVLGVLCYGVLALIVARPSMRPVRGPVREGAPGIIVTTETISSGMAGHQSDEAVDSVPTRLVEQALRHLHEPATLARSELISPLSWTLAATRMQAGGAEKQPTVLEQAQTLRAVLVAAVERLNPGGDGAVAPLSRGLQYQILRDEYLQGMPTKQVIARLGIGEATFHRRRREAIRALADELREHELRAQRLGRPSPEHADTF
jgi:hypothetical protein